MINEKHIFFISDLLRVFRNYDIT